MNKIHLYFKIPKRGYRYFPGDRYLYFLVKRLLKKEKVSGIKKVFNNLCKGLDELDVKYDINLPFEKINPAEPVVVLGTGRCALQGYNKTNPLIAGIGLMTHPSEWPNLFKEYPVAVYLQHSEWANNIYIPYYGVKKSKLWPAGIDTDKWTPSIKSEKKFDFLIYNKIRWDYDQQNDVLKNPILYKLDQLGLTYHEIIYGYYDEEEYCKLLQQCRAMIFLCEHESQGFACCEALTMNVPVFAWDQGFCLDPNRFDWNDPVIPASSVPFFDDRCGMKFIDFSSFENNLHSFWHSVIQGEFKPRDYILENLTLKKSAQKMLDIISSIYK